MATTRLTFAEAADYQESFDAVEAGTAAHAQAVEVAAVMEGLEHLRAIGARAGQIVDARINLLAGVPEDKRATVVEAVDGKDAAAPRILFDADERKIMTPEESAAAATARAAVKRQAEEAAAAEAQQEDDAA